MNKLAQGITIGLLIGMTGMAYAAPAANAVPTNPTNVTGKNTWETKGTTAAPILNVTQVNPVDTKGNVTSHTAQINWSTFNIGSAATVNFKQSSSGDTMINNVATTGGMSEIAGKMNASGNVVLINPNGATFYNGATINVGGLAVYAANSTDLSAANDKTNQANITIENGVTINAGISTALNNLTALGIAPADYAIGINQYSNRIRLVANGNIVLGDKTSGGEAPKLVANDTTYTDNSQSSLGEEGYSTSESSNEMYGQVAIRADANADDYGQVIVNGNPVITTQESRIYSNPEIAKVNTTADGVQYNRKNYNSMPATDSQFNMVKGNHVTVTAKAEDTGATIIADRDEKDTTKKTGKYVVTDSGTTNANVRMLINNIAQLQDIDPNTTNNNGGNSSYGNLAGKYAMGKTIDATNDTAVYIKNGILYTQDQTTNKIIGVVVADNSVFSSATKKTLSDGTVIDYDNTNNKVITGNYAYTSTGTFSKTDSGKTYTTNTGDTSSTYSDGTTTYTKDTTTGTTSYTSGTNTFSNNGTSTTLNNGTNTFTKTGTTTSYNNGTYDISQTSGTTSYTNSGTTYSQTGTTTQYVSGSDIFALASGAAHASMKNGTNTYTTDGTNVYLNGSTTPYAGTDAATILSNLNNATTSLTAAAGVLTPAATLLSTAATAITTADGNITTANTNIATFLSDTANTTARTELGTAYTQFTTSTAALSTEGVGTKSLSIINSANWDSKKGFQPIGSTANPFTGSLDGYGGDTGHPVNNLTIKRGGTNGTDGENNVGLFGVISGGSVSSFTLGGPKIQGQNNVGGIAGSLINGGTISWSSVTGPGQKGVEDYTETGKDGKVIDTGYVATTRTGSGARENIGAVAGYVESSTIAHVSNSATVIGQTSDGTVNVSNVGGIAGKVSKDHSATSAAITSVTNGGNVFGEKAVGGLVGYGENMSIGATAGKTDLTAASYNNGQITGQDETGGIMGHASGVTLKYVFNTNEDTPLSKNSMYYIDASGNIVKQGGTADTTLAGNALNSTAALSKYGQVTGVTNTGGMVGFMENYSATKKSSIDTAYNAGNVTATGANTGGLVGQMTGGTITNAYNGDNNTVIKSDNYDKITLGEKPVPDDVINHKQTDGKTLGWNVTVGSETKTFAYDEFSAKYYGFYTADGKAYYFIPTNGKTTKGAGGIYVDAAGNIMDVNNSKSTQYIKESDRFYFNRLAYKDANITGTTNVGGVIGNMSGGDVATVYDVGTVKSTDAATTGGLIGIGAGTGTGTEATTKLTDSFYITGSDKSLMNKVYSSQSNAIGSDTGVYKTGVEASGRTLADMESRDTIKKTYTTDDWLGSITKVDTNTGRTEYNDGAIQWDGKEKIYDGSSENVLYYRPTVNGTQQTYYLKTGDATTQYTFGTDTNGNITLTSNGTTPTVINYNAVKVSSNQGTNWLVYEQQTLPLLKYYMTDLNLSRVFEYDGTTHNLKTDDVTNLYGRADFADGAGQVVYKEGEEESTTYSGSSVYYYDNSSIWSPQHGYIMDAMAAVTITPKALDVVITGERTYGAVGNTKGYYVCVPYETYNETTKVTTQNYAFYTVTGEGADAKYTLLTGTALTNLLDGTTYKQDEAGLKARAKADGVYVVTLNGIIDTEATKLDSAVSNAVKALGNLSSGANLNGIFSSGITGGDQRLDATTTTNKYTVDKTKVSGLVAQNNDYDITYNGSLLVDKTDLYFTYTGVRNYGVTNNLGTNTFTVAGTDLDSTTTSAVGLLKTWDAAKLGSLTGSTGQTYNLFGTVADGNKNITSLGTLGIANIANYDTTGKKYYQVMVDASGNVLGYVLTSTNFNDGKTGSPTISFVGTTSAYTTNLANNYNLVWKVGGAATLNTTTATGASTGTYTIANSTETINPVTLTVTVAGERDYGTTMGQTTYTTSTTDKTPTLTKGTYNVNLTGLVGTDKVKDTAAEVLNATNVQALVNGIEDKTSEVNATKISDHTNAGTYDIKAGTTLTGSNITVTGQDSTSKHYNLLAANNYNYKLEDGNHTEKIDKIAATITTKGSRTYGDANSTTTDYATTAAGIKNWDTILFTGLQTSQLIKDNITNTTADAAHVGTYGKLGAQGTTQVITYNDGARTNIANALSNYTVSYADEYTVKKAPLTITVTGQRTYGDSMDATADYTVTSGAVPVITGLKAGTYNIDVNGIKNVNGDSAAGVLNKTGVQTKLVTVDNTAGGNTTGDVVGSHTNVGEYTGASNVKFTLNNTNAIDNTNDILNSGDYYVANNGTNTLKINPRPVTITTTGGRKFGAANPTTDQYTITTSDGGLTTWDKTALYGTNGTDGTSGHNWKAGIVNSTDANTPKGVYGTLSKEEGRNYQVLSYAADSQLVNDLATNYKVTYADQFNVDKTNLVITITGSKIYSDATDLNSGKYTITSEGLENSDRLVYTGVINDVDIYANVGTYSKGNGTDTITGITGLKDLTGFVADDYYVTYKTTYIVTPKDLLLTTTGSRIYGDTNDTIKYDNIAATTGAIVNPADLTTFNNYQDTLKKAIQVDKSVTEQTDAGTYGTLGTTSRATLTYAEDQQKATTAQLGGNYNVMYADELTITKRPITHSLDGTKEYGTGSDHTTYTDGGFTNVPDFAKGTINENTPKNVTNTSDRYTTVGDYNNSLLGVTYSGDWTKNYDITEVTKLTVTPADFTYTADDTSYWRGMNIPPQSGKVTNRYGEDVSDLVGNRTWPTPADHTSPAGKYPIIGHGANDNSGNYKPLQAPGNDTALTIKEGQEGPEKRTLIPGGWGPVRRPLLDIRYLYIEGTQGINRWGDAAYSITGGDNHKAAGVDTLSGMGLASSQGYIPAQGVGVGTFYSKDKDKVYRF
jgi:filamentous hemagglutinin family protein